MSNFEKVKRFTEESCGVENRPSPLTFKEGRFIVKMVVSEMLELLESYDINTFDTLQEIIKELKNEEPKRDRPNGELQVMATQYDSLLDSCYYIYNCFAKKGVNYDALFDVVHNANMAKKFEDGTFHKREDGKIIKPEGWQEPNIEKEIARQLN